MQSKNVIINESAIKSEKDDLLNYYPFAQKIKEIIQGYSSNPEPLTIGIYGKWGSGKTSLLNLIEKHIEIFQKDKTDKPYIKFHYNPWIYQSKEEMLFDFFETLSAKLIYTQDTNLQIAGAFITKYSKYLKSITLSANVGIPKIFNMGVKVEPYEIFKSLGEDLEGQRPTIETLKNKIDKALIKGDKKIIIFIDDIDRLDKEEIFALFKLIKVIADFKNLVFVLCMDSVYVAEAIYTRYGEEKISGKRFLEKIINIPLELPLIQKSDLDYFLKEKVTEVLKNKVVKEKDIDELKQSLNGNYFSNPREILRTVNSFSISYYAIGDEVNLHDLYWIEYLKINHNETYNMIKSYGKDIPSNQAFSSIINLNDLFENENQENGLRKEIKEKYPEGYSIVNFLFPIERHNVLSAFENNPLKSEKDSNTELRINHVDHFEKYFSFHTKGKISEIKYFTYKNYIHNQKEEDALKILKEIHSEVKERVLVYRLLADITEEVEEQYKIHIPFIIKNLELFKDTSSYSSIIQIVQSFANKLKQKPIENKEIIILISDSLSFENLGGFISTLTYQLEIPYLNEIELKFIEKIKSLNEIPFYKNSRAAKLAMDVWAKHEKKEFQKYIFHSFEKKSNIEMFFNGFPIVWNGSIIGIFSQRNFEYLLNDLKLDVEKIYSKILPFYPETESLEKLEKFSQNWDERTTNSGTDNVRQFAYLYLKSISS